MSYIIVPCMFYPEIQSQARPTSDLSIRMSIQIKYFAQVVPVVQQFPQKFHYEVN